MIRKQNPKLEETTHGTISKRLRKIVGIVTLPPNFNEEKELRAYFSNKHLR